MIRRRVSLVLGICLLVAAAVAAGYNRQQDAAAGRASRQLLEQVLTLPGEPSNAPDLSPTAELSPDGEDPSVLGVLEIPALAVTLPILHDCTPELLELAPGRFEGGVAQGRPERLIIAGHNYRVHFGELSRLQEGDTLTFAGASTGSAPVAYRVREVITIENNDYPGLTAGEWDLILFTCNFARDKRIVVKAIEEKEDL